MLVSSCGGTWRRFVPVSLPVSLPVLVAAVLWTAATSPWCGRALAAETATETAAQPPPAAVADGRSSTPAGPGQPVATDAPQDSVAEGSAAETGETKDRVLVRVNGDPIMVSEFNARIVLRLPAAGSHGDLSPERVAQHQRELLQDMVVFRLMLQDARQRAIEVSETDVDREEVALRERFRDEDSFRKAAAGQGLDLAHIREGLREHALVRRVQEQVEATVAPPTQAQLREYYAAHPDKFRIPPQAAVRYLLVEVDASAPPDVWEAARERVAQMRRRVTAEGASLDTVWQEMATQKGVRAADLGLIHEGQADLAEVGKAAFALKAGELGEPVFTLFGYALVHVARRVEGRQMAFDELKLDLFSAEWLTARRTEARAAWLKGLMDRAKLEFPE